MITNMDQLITLTKTVSGLTDVYRGYPEAQPEAPFAIISTVSNNDVLNIDAEEIVSTATYQVDIYAEDPATAEDYAASVDSVFKQYGIIRSGYFDGFEPSNGLRRVTISFRVTLDKRGNTY